ncbi:MAG: hypothetical protein OXM55_06390 [Bdellovibrionales bacterium]|nr:hypothetical protein [Bdellovibrionales bacterium]
MFIISDFFIRFVFFCLKIILSCFFIIVLQVQVGQKSLEQWIEQELKESTFSRSLKRNARVGIRVINKKLPGFKGLAQNKIIKNNSILEFHSGVLHHKENSFKEEVYNLEERDLASSYDEQE